MECSKCKNPAVISSPRLCKEHFLSYVEENVKESIKRFSLLNKQDKILVATSGGKDSISILHMLSMWYDNVSALAIDEGIEGYRDITLDDLRYFCKERNINLKIVSFRKEFGETLDAMLKKRKNPCSVCGTLRRRLLNTYSRGFDVIATGHNMDDESQSVVMNLLQGHPMINARLGPQTGLLRSDKFTPRIKPFYLLAEREIKLYSILKGFKVQYTECPYVDEAYRGKVGEMINSLESKYPGTKRNILENFLLALPKLKKNAKTEETEILLCSRCGEPSRNEVCSTCLIVEGLKNETSQQQDPSQNCK